MRRTLIRRLAVASLFTASAAAATDLQILCREGAHVRLDGADAGVCRDVEEGRYLRDLAPGKHVVEVTPPGSSEARRYEVELDEVVPGRLDARDKDTQVKSAGSLYVQCIPQRCTVELAGTELEIDQDDLRLKEVPAGRYALRFQRGKKTLEAVAFVKEEKPTGVRADFLAGRAGIISAAEVPRLGDARWGMAQTLEAAVRERQMWEQFNTELQRMEALRNGESVQKPEGVPPPRPRDKSTEPPVHAYPNGIGVSGGLAEPLQHPEVKRRGVQAVHLAEDVEERRCFEEEAPAAEKGGDYNAARIFRIHPLALQIPGERRIGGVAEPHPGPGLGNHHLIDERRPLVRGQLSEDPVVRLCGDLAEGFGEQHGTEVLHDGSDAIARTWRCRLVSGRYQTGRRP